MSRPHSPRTVSRARALFAEGISYAEISRTLGVHVNTVIYWAQRDAKRGVPWHTLRTQRLAGSTLTLQRELVDHIAELLHQPEASSETPMSEERIVKMLRALEGYRKLDADLSACLATMQSFAEFCTANLSPETIACIRDAVEAYLDDLKRKHS